MTLLQNKTERLWGWYKNLWDEKNFKIKLLYFDPDKEPLSNQRHFFRNELWLFIKGRGMMEVGCDLGVVEKVKEAGDYQMVEILDWHKFTAFEPTYVIEIQWGNKCDEKDIERK